jgi:broad specificity phosphatase PhoE
MSKFPTLIVARHGETAWSLSGQHTGRTDIPLTPNGEREAEALGRRLRGLDLALLLTSPLQRARRTSEIAVGDHRATLDPDLAEWDYGDYEGITTAEILTRRPGWSLFRDGCPNGETAAQVGARADRAIARIRANPGSVLVFSHGHFSRVLAARWLGLPAGHGCYFTLSTASLSILGYEHGLTEPVILSWNDTAHLDRDGAAAHLGYAPARGKA